MFGLPVPKVTGSFDLPEEFSQSLPDEAVYGGIASQGEASAYSQVWEWGNVRQYQKGPKTTFGINPDGERIWLTIQAPFGYVRINSTRFADAILQEMASVDPSSTEITQQLYQAAGRASVTVASIARETVPVDTGALRDSIVAVETNAADLLDVDHWSEGSWHQALGEE